MKKRSNTHNTSANSVNLRFAAINTYIDQQIVAPTESYRNKYVEWGTDNQYPEYLLSLYKTTATLRSIINGSTDYVSGDEVRCSVRLWGECLNTKGQTAMDVVQALARDYFIYGGFALQIIRNADNQISEIYPVDFRALRSAKDNEAFYYSEEWRKRFISTRTILYPKYMPDAIHPSSILYVKNTQYQTYPEPLYAASVKACEIERSIDEFHLNSINNGFAGSYIVNFNNGVPDDDIKDEIERDFNEKFAGKNNAGRICFSWADTKENAITLERMEMADYGERYETLAKHCRQQIFTAFRANPNLFGIPTENLGFSNEEYESAFKLYNRTQIQPVQRLICGAFDKIFGKSDVLTIVPFSMSDNSNKTIE